MLTNNLPFGSPTTVEFELSFLDFDCGTAEEVVGGLACGEAVRDILES